MRLLREALEPLVQSAIRLDITDRKAGREHFVSEACRNTELKA